MSEDDFEDFEKGVVRSNLRPYVESVQPPMTSSFLTLTLTLTPNLFERAGATWKRC
jgi:hypothetical protein